MKTFYQLRTDAAPPQRAITGLAVPDLKKEIAKLCRTNFLVFQKVELGMEIGKHHKEWANRLITKKDVCEMAPRDHGKSMSMARAYPLWRAKYDPWCEDIYLLGADLPSAVENLDKIKEMLYKSPSLHTLIPTERADGMNSRTEMMLKNGTTIRSKGYQSPLRGRHPQLIVLDDVLNEKNSLTPNHRRDVASHFWEVIFPMKDKGLPSTRRRGHFSQIVVVGTAQDREDLYHELHRNDAFIGDKMVSILDDFEEEVLWPERYSYADLMSIKAAAGALHFSKEYMNEPLSDDTTIFPPSLFEPLKDREISYQNGYTGNNPVYLGVDFSIPGSADGDWTVVLAVEFDPLEHLYTVLNYWRARPDSTQEQIHKIELWCELYKVSAGFLEDNIFQRIYAEHFRRNTVLPLVGHTVTSHKKMSVEYGIVSFRPQFENGRWRFPYKNAADQQKTDLIVTEFNGIRQKDGKIGNMSYHDDIVMAMWHAASASTGTAFQADWGD